MRGDTLGRIRPGPVALVAVVLFLTALGVAGTDGAGPATNPYSAAVGEPPAAATDTSLVASGSADAAGLPADDEAAIVAPDRFDGPPPATVPPPRQLDPPVAATGTGLWAVVVGVDDYPGRAADLRAAVADARMITDTLVSYGARPEQILLLRDGQVTAQTVDAAARWLAASAGPDSTALFAFAGHIRMVNPGTEALVTSDGSVYRDDQLAAALAPLRSRQSWFLLAGCYAGGFTEVLGPGRILTAAAERGRLAYENMGYGHSYMVEYMVRRALYERQAGPDPSVQEAFAWARDRLARDHPGREPVAYWTAPVEPISLSGAAGPAGGADSAGGGGGGSSGSGGQRTAPSRQPPPTTSTTRPKRCVLFCSSGG